MPARGFPRFCLLILASLVAVLLAGSIPTWAQNENETVGFRPNHTFESGAFGEDIDILNGGLNLTIPIGPGYQVDSRLGYKLTLGYNSKIWDTTDFMNSAIVDTRQVIQRGEGPFGIGFTLHMGRIFKDPQRTTACLAGECSTASWVFVSQDGSQHAFFYDAPDSYPAQGVSAGPIFDRRKTDDLSYYKISGPANQYCPNPVVGQVYPACFRVEARDGLVYTLEERIPCVAPGNLNDPLYGKRRSDNLNFCGWYTTLIEDRSIVAPPSSGLPTYPQRVTVTYDARQNFQHAMATIGDAAGRTIQFHNCEWGGGHCSGATTRACNTDDHCAVGQTCQSGAVSGDQANRCIENLRHPTVTDASDASAVATYAVDLPAFAGNATNLTSDIATYAFQYTYEKVTKGDYSFESCNGNPACVNGHLPSDPVLKLTRIDYPAYVRTPGSPGDLYSLYFGYLNTDPSACGWEGGLGLTEDHGEIACRTLPLLRQASGDASPRIVGNACEVSGTWPMFKYGHAYYNYRAAFLSAGHTENKNCNAPSPGTCSTGAGAVPVTGQTRQVVKKSVVWPGSQSDWTYCRDVSSKTNPTKVTVTDPFSNQTVYRYRASTSQATPATGKPDADNGLAPEWDDGVNSEIDFYEGSESTGRLVRRTEMDYDTDHDYSELSEKAKGNLRVPLTKTTHVDDDNRIETVSRANWDDEGHWLQEVNAATDVPEAKVTVRTYQSSGFGSIVESGYNLYIADLVQVEETSDGTHVLSRVDNEYDNSRGWLLSSVSRSSPLAAGIPPTTTQYAGDVKTTYSYNLATGNVTSKTITSGPSDPGYSVAYTWGPAIGQCPVLATVLGAPLTGCGGYLTTKAFLSGGTQTWKAIDRDRDANTGLIFGTRDSAGVQTTYSYDALGRVMQVTPQGEEPTVIDYVSLLETTVRQGDPGSGDYVFARYKYDGLGRQITEEKRVASATQMSCQTKKYDAENRVTFTAEWRYDDDCQPGDAGEVGTVTSYKPSDVGPTDPLGRPRRLIPADSQGDTTTGTKLTKTDYFGNSSRVTVTGVIGSGGIALSEETTFYHDERGRLVYVDAPSDKHCSQSNATCTQSSNCPSSESCMVMDGGADALYTYDAADQLIKVQLGNGVSPPQVREFAYDDLGHLTWEKHPESGLTVYESYDALGNPLIVRDFMGNVRRYVYDFAGRLKEQRVTPAGGTERLVLRNSYDATGGGRGYSAGKLTTIESFDEAGVVSLTEQRYYEGIGGRLSKTTHQFADWSGALTTIYTYNTRGQVARVDYPIESTPLHSPLSVTFGYSNGQPITATEVGNGRVLGRITYSAAGAVATLETPGLARTEVLFDNRNRPLSISIDKELSGGIARVDYMSGEYRYDGAGNIYRRDNTSGGGNPPPFGSYGYDAANRLVSSTTRQGGEEYQESFTYDAFGNMTQKTLATLGAGTTETDAFSMSSAGVVTNRILNRTTTLGSGSGSTGNVVPFSYDLNGNLFQGGRSWYSGATLLNDIKRYEYNPLNRLMRVLQVGAGTDPMMQEVDRFSYDGSGNRVTRVVGEDGAKTYYVRDPGGQVISEFRRPVLELTTVVPEWSKDYVYLAGRLVSMKENLRPQQPVGMRVSSMVNQSGWLVNIAWDANLESDLAAYRVYRQIQGLDSGYVYMAQVSTAGYSDSQSHPQGRVLLYRVTGVDLAGYESTASATLKVVAGDSTVPSKPSLNSIVAGDGRVYLSWTASTDASGIAGYEIVRRTSLEDPGTPLTVDLLTNRTYTDMYLQNGVTYYYRVRAKDTAGNWGPYSCAPGQGVCDKSAVPKDYSAPVPVQGLSICETGGLTSTYTLLWQANPDSDNVTGYRVYRNTVPAFGGASPSPTLLATVTATSYQVTPSGYGLSYYSVRAIDGASPANESWWSVSQPAYARDPASRPETTLFATGYEGSVQLSWHGVGGDHYNLYRRLSGYDQCYERVAQVPVSAWPMVLYTDPVPVNNVAYDYAITATTDGVESAFSRPAIGVPLSRTTGLFVCARDDQFDTDITVAGNDIQWAPPVARPYQPLLASLAEGEPGFLKGYHVFHFRPSTNAEDTYDTSVMRRLMLSPDNVVDPYFIQVPKDNPVVNYDARFNLHYAGSFATPASPAFLEADDAWSDYSGNFTVCVLPKAVYKVYAQGTWLTAESELPSQYDTSVLKPYERCTTPLGEPLSQEMPACGGAGWVPAPTNLRVASDDPGAVVIAWDPPADSTSIAGYRIYVYEAHDNSAVIQETSLRPSVPYATVGPEQTSIRVSGLADLGYPVETTPFQFQVVSFDVNGRMSLPLNKMTSQAGAIQRPGVELTVPGAPRSLRILPWTLNDNVHARTRKGIKVAWGQARVGSGQTLAGFRIYRSEVPGDYGCALLRSGTPVPALPGGATQCVTTAAETTNYTSTTVTDFSGFFLDPDVVPGRAYYYRITQLESDGAGHVTETPMGATEQTSGRQMFYDPAVLPPPQGLMAYAPYDATSPDVPYIYVRACKVPTIQSPDAGMTDAMEYRIYRTATIDGVARRHARVAPGCLDSNPTTGLPTSRCEITASNRCDDASTWAGCSIIQPIDCGGSQQPACVGIVDRNIGQWPLTNDDPGTQRNKNYVYHMSAVGVTEESESSPSLPDEGWPNYCLEGGVNCHNRFDPEGKTGTLVCGWENVQLLGHEPIGSTNRTKLEASSGEVMSPYRTIGDPPTCEDCDGSGGGSSNPYTPPARFVFYHTDHLGSPRVVYDGAGTVLEKHDLLPFGEERPVSAPTTTNTRFFTGHERDPETGLDYMMARYYSSSLGRFMAVDPGDDTALEDPQSWNKYAYVRNNPLRLVDRQGTTGKDCVIDHPRNWPKPSAPLGPTTTTVMVKGTVQGGMTGASISGGIAWDNQGNVGLVGSVSFKMGPGILVSGGIEVSGQPGAVQDLQVDSQQVCLDVNSGPGIGLSVDNQLGPQASMGPVSVEPGGAGVALTGGYGGALTQDLTHTGVVMIVGDDPPPPPRQESGPVMNAVDDDK